jgi:hypothetical protein
MVVPVVPNGAHTPVQQPLHVLQTEPEMPHAIAPTAEQVPEALPGASAQAPLQQSLSR